MQLMEMFIKNIIMAGEMAQQIMFLEAHCPAFVPKTCITKGEN